MSVAIRDARPEDAEQIALLLVSAAEIEGRLPIVGIFDLGLEKFARAVGEKGGRSGPAEHATRPDRGPGVRDVLERYS